MTCEDLRLRGSSTVVVPDKFSVEAKGVGGATLPHSEHILVLSAHTSGTLRDGYNHVLSLSLISTCGAVGLMFSYELARPIPVSVPTTVVQYP